MSYSADARKAGTREEPAPGAPTIGDVSKLQNTPADRGRKILERMQERYDAIERDLVGDRTCDPLIDLFAEQRGLYDYAHGHLLIEQRDLSADAHRSLHHWISMSPQSRRNLEQHADTLMLVPALQREHGSADEFRRWWQWCGEHDCRHLPVDLAGYLRRLSLFREVRSLAVRVFAAAEALDHELGVEHMRGVAVAVRELRALAGAGAAA